MLNFGQFLCNLLCGQKLLLKVNTLLWVFLRLNEEDDGREAREADVILLLSTGAIGGNTDRELKISEQVK